MGVAVRDRALDAGLQVGTRHVLRARDALPLELLTLADVDEHDAVAEPLVHLGRVDLVDPLLDLLDDLGARRAHRRKLLKLGRLFTSVSIAMGRQPMKHRVPAMKLGYSIGYWAGGPPPGAAEAIAEAERLGFDSIWTAEAYGSDALTPLAWWGARDASACSLGTAIVQMSRAHAGRHGDGGDDDRPPLGRALHPRPRRVGPAGGRGLVRPAVRQAARAHPRVRRDHARHLRARGAGDQRRRALHAAATRAAPGSASR